MSTKGGNTQVTLAIEIHVGLKKEQLYLWGKEIQITKKIWENKCKRIETEMIVNWR